MEADERVVVRSGAVADNEADVMSKTGVDKEVEEEEAMMTARGHLKGHLIILNDARSVMDVDIKRTNAPIESKETSRISQVVDRALVIVPTTVALRVIEVHARR